MRKINAIGCTLAATLALGTAAPALAQDFVGTPRKDKITGTPADDRILSLAGKDKANKAGTNQAKPATTYRVAIKA